MKTPPTAPRAAGTGRWLGAMAFALAACAGSVATVGEGRAVAEATPILWISLDTVRADRFELGVEGRGGTLIVHVDGREVTRCRGAWGPGALVLGAGVRRVQVDDVVVRAGSDTVTSDFGGVGRTQPAGGLAALAGALTGALPLLGRLDVRGLLDTPRLLDVPDALGPPLLAGLPAALLTLLVTGARAATLRTAAARGLAGLVAGGLVASLTRGDAAGLGALGVPLAALGWVNTHPFARRVSVSWALVALLILGAEGAVRLTALDATWTRTAGWRRASEEFAELVELRRWRSDLWLVRYRGFDRLLLTHRRDTPDARADALLTRLCGDPVRAPNATLWRIPAVDATLDEATAWRAAQDERVADREAR